MSTKLKMMYKTYTFENSTNIYVPKPVVKRHGVRYCCCVHVCKQFLEYPVDNWGRRIIPVDAICPYVTGKLTRQKVACSAAFLSVDGKITTDTKNMQLNKVYIDARGR